MWKVSSQDMNLGLVSAGSTSCVGAITGVDVGLGDASWILGDAFLKVRRTLTSPMKVEAHCSLPLERVFGLRHDHQSSGICCPSLNVITHFCDLVVVLFQCGKPGRIGEDVIF